MATPSRADSPDPTLCSNLIMPSSQNLADAAQQQQAPTSEGDDAVPATTSEAPIAPSARVPSIHEEQDISAASNEAEPVPTPAVPKASITLLLVSGRRRTVEFERSITVGEMKETVWSTWPSDWSDELPPSAAFLRILYLGRILTDETTIASLNLPEPPEATVVHVSVRSFAPTSSDEDLKKKPKKRGSRRGRSAGTDASGGAADGRATNDAEEEEAGGCCGCVIC